MADFYVNAVVDGDTFTVSGGWTWKDQTGDIVRPTGYDAPEMDSQSGQAVKTALSNLILGQKVQVGNAYTLDHGRLVCDVFYQGKYLADYFPRYKS